MMLFAWMREGQINDMFCLDAREPCRAQFAASLHHVDTHLGSDNRKIERAHARVREVDMKRAVAARLDREAWALGPLMPFQDWTTALARRGPLRGGRDAKGAPRARRPLRRSWRLRQRKRLASTYRCRPGAARPSAASCTRCARWRRSQVACRFWPAVRPVLCLP